MVTEIDRKLILALQENGRMSNVELSRRLGLHVSTISKKIEQLEEAEIMKIRALPNPFKLGYNANAYIAIEAESQKIERICSRLMQRFHVNLVVTAFGRYDIIAGLYFPSWENLLDFVSSELAANQGVKSVETFLVKEIKKRYYGFIVDDRAPVKIDEIDQKIIEKLTEDGRTKNRYLAQELGISAPACLRRLARLIGSKVIEIKAIPNPSQLGYASNAFLFLRVEPGKLDEVCARLTIYEDVFLITTLFNGHDLLIGVNGTSPEALYKFKNKILSIDGIVHDETIIRAEIKKRYYGGFLE
jgi:Lrp/AsnC family transcriptional regulator for asnA, asnC and gidA